MFTCCAYHGCVSCYRPLDPADRLEAPQAHGLVDRTLKRKRRRKKKAGNTQLTGAYFLSNMAADSGSDGSSTDSDSDTPQESQVDLVNPRLKRHPYNGKTMSQLYAATISTESKIRQHMELEVMWACRWEALKKQDGNIRQFLADQPVRDVLQIRSALFGGRTCGIRPYYKCKKGETIKYLDFTSK